MTTSLTPQPPPTIHPRHDELETVRLLARLMDTAVVIPGTRFRVGFDVLLGLLPGIGDLVAAAVSTYIVTVAARLGVPRPVILRMLLNIGVDTVGGSVPFVGDVFDAAWKANVMNVALLEKALADPRAARRSSTWVIVGLCALGFATAVVGIALAIWLAHLLTKAVG